MTIPQEKKNQRLYTNKPGKTVFSASPSKYTHTTEIAILDETNA